MAKWIKTKNEIDKLNKLRIVKIELTQNGLGISSIHHDCGCKPIEEDSICINVKTLYYSKEDLQKLIKELEIICEKVPTDEMLLK